MSTPTTALAPTTTDAVARPAQPEYADLDRWRRYQSFFPESMRSRDASTTPDEERWSWRGLDVHIDRLGDEQATLKVIVLHGAGAYGRIMAPVSVIAQQHGYATVAPDLPGYGLTEVPWAQMDYGLWVDCVCDLIDREVARDGLPIVLFGVSLGGLLAYQVAARHDAVRGVIATTLLDPRETDARQDLSRFRFLGSAGFWFLESFRGLTDRLPLPMAYMTKMHGISNDPELAALCASDRMGGGNWVPAGFLRTLMTQDPAMEPEAFDRCPILLVHPGADRMTDISLSRRFFDRLACDKRMVVLEGTSHMPTEPVGLEQLQSAVLDFLDAITGDLEPS